MSLCYAIYDGGTRSLKFANSGAPPPILCKKGKAEVLSIAGFPLGMFDKADYREMEVRLEAGDSVIFYTDGLPEARDLRGREFGIERLQESVERNSTLAVKKLVEKIFTQIEKFTLDNRKYDDQTVVAFKATEKGA